MILNLFTNPTATGNRHKDFEHGHVLQDALRQERRASPLIKSKVEDKERGFKPVYSQKQLEKKGRHTFDILETFNSSSAAQEYQNSPPISQRIVDLANIERLLSHPDTEIYTNVMGQDREPIILALNRGNRINGNFNYSIPNHVASFERRPEIYEHNSYISNYVITPNQVIRFYDSMNHTTSYEDSFGNLKTNIGPIFGEASNKITSAPISESSSFYSEF